MISVAVVHAQRDIREGLAKTLDHSEYFQCIGLYGDGNSGAAGILGSPPDILLLDLDLPDISGIECIRQIRRQAPSVDIVIFTRMMDDEHIFNAFEAGALGYLPSDTFHSDLLKALQELRDGGAPMAPFVARKLVASLQKGEIHLPTLSEREEAVLKLLCEGLTNKEMARRLFVSPNTIGFHLKNIYKKMDVNSRHEAIAKAKKLPK